jgi:arylsulfatase A-like enzyme
MVRKFHKHVVLFALLGVLASLGTAASYPESSQAQMANKPNIVFILTDDMRASDLDKVVNGQYVMPKTRNLLVTQGVKFTKPWVTRSLCCPSRATVLRGQYTHNHRVWVNVNPSGGFWNFYDRGLESSTIATWLDRRDGIEYYDTILIGKYLNRYGLALNGTYQPTTHVPQGWDKWYAWEGTYDSPNTYDINQNGRIVTHQRSQIHDTDLYANKAVNFIRGRTASSPPFFMYLAPNAPHKPAYSAPRHANLFTDTPLPKPSSFNEADVSDKPAWVRNKPRLSSTKIQELTTLYRQRLRALKSVDDMVGRVVGTLSDIGELDNTYIVLTSDNGYYLGEHRLEEKAAAYNAAPRIPLVIRGPGVPPGVSRPQMVLNNDFAPTFASWAGVQPPPFVDGRSLKPLLTTSPPPPWRSAFLVEHRKSPEEYAYVRAIPNYDAVRTPQYSYVEYATGERELYDLNADPTELTNIYNSASPTLISNLQGRLNALKSCAGWDASSTSCKTAENGG